MSTSTAIHEAGHAVVAAVLGCDIEAVVGVPCTVDGEPAAGVCVHSGTSPFNGAVIGVAGPMAEAMAGYPPMPSQEDVAPITDENAARAIAEAKRILTANWKEVTTLAEVLDECGTAGNAAVQQIRRAFRRRRVKLVLPPAPRPMGAHDYTGAPIHTNYPFDQSRHKLHQKVWTKHFIH
ncbi:hypothetical protein [Humisphaera borealis]|uniref:Peptidase M41 domain-containing protein n=1 Tax=Humisphaera borealis TaxID=2807512 RepID=A0A7M2X0W5_9BACT|nr:hypothetical protein [Humisphaera borealis]QOV91072.1 hypothetical protein IPV69_06850 [Humisphaera borealis]